MKTEGISTEKEASFLEPLSSFIEENESRFVDYFSSLSLASTARIHKEQLLEVAIGVYRSIFSPTDLLITKARKSLLELLYHDEMMMRFLVSRSLLYLLEQLMLFGKERDEKEKYEIILAAIMSFLDRFESKSPSISGRVGLVGEDSQSTFGIFNTILTLFIELKNRNGSVEFLNLYQGVPVRSFAKVIATQGENVLFQLEKKQEIAMDYDGQAFIVKDDFFDKHIKADIVHIDTLNHTVTLNNFRYLLNMPALQREFVRVHPDIVANVYVRHFGAPETVGRLYDLSLNGLGVLSAEHHGIVAGDRVLVTFELNTTKAESGERIELQAEVVTIIEYKGSYRYCMRIFPQKEMLQKIERYIAARETEILEELEASLG